MTQTLESQNRPAWLKAERTARKDSAPVVQEQYPNDPTLESNNPNVALSYNTRNQVWSRTTRAANAGAMRDRQTANRRPLLADEQHGSTGFVKDVGGSTTFEGEVIYGKVDTIEEGGEDPISPKVPRKSYITGIVQSGTANVNLGVSADSWKTVTLESGNVQIDQDLEPEKVWWGGNKKIEGTRLSYRIEHEDSTQLAIESFINEHRSRGRR